MMKNNTSALLSKSSEFCQFYSVAKCQLSYVWLAILQLIFMQTVIRVILILIWYVCDWENCIPEWHHPKIYPSLFLLFPNRLKFYNQFLRHFNLTKIVIWPVAQKQPSPTNNDLNKQTNESRLRAKLSLFIKNMFVHFSTFELNHFFFLSCVFVSQPNFGSHPPCKNLSHLSLCDFFEFNSYRNSIGDNIFNIDSYYRQLFWI